MNKYQMINRNHLLKAEDELLEAILWARHYGDDKLADLIGKTLDDLSMCRSRCWEMGLGEE